MALTNVGRNHIASGLIGGAVTDFTNANSYIGVGDSTNVFSATGTDLVAITNVLRKGMDPSYPVCVSGNILLFQSTFATSEANFAWQEWGVFNNSTTGVMLNRKVESLGTKTSAQSWVIQTAVTINNP